MPKNDDLKNRLDEIFSGAPKQEGESPAPLLDPIGAAVRSYTSQDAESLYKTVFESIALGMVLTGIDGRLLHINAAFARLLGYTQDELVGKNFQDLTYPDDKTVGAEALKAMVEGKTQTARIEKRYVHKDGRAVWVELNVILLMDADQKPLRFVTIAQDISHQHRTAYMLEKRVRELNCLNDIGHQIDEKPPLPEFLSWICKRIPSGFQYSEVCISAIEYEGAIYGDPRTLQQTAKVVGGLRVGHNLVGWLHVAYTEPRDFVDAESALLGSIISRVCGYIDTIKAGERSERHLHELATLNELGRAISSELDLTKILEHVYHFTGRLMDTENFFVAMYDEVSDMIAYPVVYVDGAPFFLPTRSPLNGLTEYILRTGRQLVFGENVVDHMKELGIDFVPLGDDEVPLSWVGVPISYNNRVLGVISLQSVKAANIYGQAELEVLYSIAQQTARAVAYSKQYESMTRQAVQLAAVARISTTIANSMGVQDLMQAAVDLTKEQLNLYHAQIYLLSDDGLRLKLMAGAGDVGRAMTATGWEIDLDKETSIVARAARTRQGQVVSDVRAEAGFLPNELLPETRSELAAPLVAGDHLIGVMDVQSDQLAYFSQEDVDIMTTLAAQAAVTLQNARQYEEMRQSEVFIRTIIDVTPDWIFVKNRDHVLTLANDAFAKFMGMPLDALLGKNDLQLGFPEGLRIGNPTKGIEGSWKVDQHVLETGEPQYLYGEEHEIDGETHFLDTYKLPLRDPNGEIIGVYGYVRDVTERVKLLQTIQTESRNVEILNQMALDISSSLDVDKALRLIYENTQKFMETESFFIALYNEETQQVSFPIAYRGQSALNLPTRSLRASMSDYIIRTKKPLLFSDDVTAGMRSIGLESVVFGDSKPALSWLGVPLIFGDRVLGVISVQSTSRPGMYTERERDLLVAIAGQASSALALIEQVERLRETATTLATQEGLLRTIINSTPDWIYIKDQQGRYSLVNSGYADALHLPAEAFLGKDDLELGLPETMMTGDAEKGIPGFAADDKALFEGAEARLYPNAPVILDHEPRVFNVLRAPLQDETGQVWGVLVFARDVTLREQILAQTRQQADNLAALNQVAAEMSQAASEQALLTIAVSFAARVAEFEMASLGVLDVKNQQFDMLALDEAAKNLVPVGDPVPAKGSAAGAVINARRLMTWPGDGELESVVEGVQMSKLGMHALMSAPLFLGNDAFGVLNIVSASLAQFDPSRQALLQQVASLVSASLQSRRLLSLAQERAAQEQAFREMSANMRATFDEEAIVQVVVKDLNKMMRGRIAVEVGEIRVKSHQHGPSKPTRVGDAVVTTLQARGQPIGTLRFEAEDGKPVPFAQKQMIHLVSDQLSQALESARLFRQTQDALSETQSLYTASARLVSSNSLRDVLIAVVDASRLQEMDQVALELFDQPWVSKPPAYMLNAEVWTPGGKPPLSRPGSVSQLNQFPLMSAARPDAPLVVQDMLNDARIPAEVGARFNQTLSMGSFVFFPLVAGGEWFGAIAAQSANMIRISEGELNRITALIGQAAVVVQGLRLQGSLRERVAELTSLERQMSRKAWASYETQLGGVQGYMYNRVQVAPIMEDYAELFGQSAQVASVDAPLLVRGETIGVLGVRPDGSRGMTSEEEAFLQAVSEQVAQALERARLMEQTQKSAVELQAVAEVSTATATILDPQELLQQVVDLTQIRFGLYHAHIYLMNEDATVLNLSVGAGELGRLETAEGWSIPTDQPNSIVAQAARSRQGKLIGDVRQAEGFLENELLPMTRSELAVPMVIGNVLLGVFDVQSEVVNWFTEDDIRTYATLASQVAVALQNAKLYAEQLATVERLRELDNMKSAFLANMSHELRTPLNSILGFTQVIVEGLDGPLTNVMEGDLGLIEKNGKHLLNLINDVLDMAKIEAGRLTLSPEPINLYDLCDDVIQSGAALARDKNLYVHLNADAAGEWVVAADHVRIRQILINLMGNAIKFTETGGITIELEHCVTGVEVLEDRIQVRIRDTGIGIPKEKLDDIFEAFSQVDNTTTRKAGGTGLGLPISRRLVELHGGRLWAESEGAGCGSTLILELPVNSHV